ncbi:hypothetical protein BDZ91DRAFT_732504 [Kalaharituber pfeilii]|nr:hypothetical protein BDZ91DRAFT_732504 [Kalaharituber pfeilii]
MNTIPSRSSFRLNLALRQYRSPAYRIQRTPVSRNIRTSAAMQAKYKEGQQVEYKPVGGRESNTSSSTGVIERVLTEDTPAGDTGVTVKASEDSPRYEIRNDNTGKKSAVKEENILKKI